MENAIVLNIPLKVDVEIGKTWGDMTELMSATTSTASDAARQDSYEMAWI